MPRPEAVYCVGGKVKMPSRELPRILRILCEAGKENFRITHNEGFDEFVLHSVNNSSVSPSMFETLKKHKLVTDPRTDRP